MTTKSLQYGKASIFFLLGTVTALIVCVVLFKFFWSLMWHGVWTAWPLRLWFKWFTVSPWLWTPFWWFHLPWSLLCLPALILLALVVILFGKGLRDSSA